MGKWNHLCVTWSSTSGIVYYVNGVEVNRDKTFHIGSGGRMPGGYFVVGQVYIILHSNVKLI